MGVRPAGKPVPHRGSARRGFSLAELVVAVGVLVLMLALAGQVMTVTVQATGQATAFIDVNQSLRAFEQTLREDLRHVRRGETIMVIEGNPMNAYWSTDAQRADGNNNPAPVDGNDPGQPHARDPNREDPTDATRRRIEQPRADRLMFFTVRPATSYLQYKYVGNPAPPPVSSSVQQVVYGHAELAEYVAGSTVPQKLADPLPQFPPYPEVAPIPADRWHLARRVVHLMPSMSADPAPDAPKWLDYLNNERLNDEDLLTGASDVVGNFNFEDEVLRAARCNGTTPEHACPPYPLYWPSIFNGVTGTMNPTPYARSILDETPPALLAQRLGHYLLPGCVSFKVEWALDVKSNFVGGRLEATTDPNDPGEKQMFWFDPGDLRIDPDLPGVFEYMPLISLQQAIDDAASDVSQAFRQQRLEQLRDNASGWLPDGTRYSLQKRFDGPPNGDLPAWHDLQPYSNGQRPNLVVFVANRCDSLDSTCSFGNPSPDPDEVFPGALRITVDVIDEEGRLDQPIRHVMVIPVG